MKNYSPLLITESPLQVLTSLAVKIGLNEAIFLQQVHYWLQRSDKYIDGQNWIFNSIEDWCEQFPFWSSATIKRIIKNLENQNLLVSNNFNKSAMDRTKWYTINYYELNSFLEEKEEEKVVNSSTVKNENITNNVEKSPQTIDYTHLSKSADALDQIDTMHSIKMSHPLAQNDPSNTIRIHIRLHKRLLHQKSM